jgi:hypothetical protein
MKDLAPPSCRQQNVATRGMPNFNLPRQDEGAAIIIERFWIYCLWMTKGQMGVNT